MNKIARKLKEQTLEQEKIFRPKVLADKNRLKFHLMPKVGWLNDPNGLCQFHGDYHVFYQYSPLDIGGGMKAWGHMVSRDFIHWEQQETELFPDMPFDQDGVYSGSACVFNNKMYLFYTGNVKHNGEFDYTISGREANTILIWSEDGKHFSNKKLLMTNADYPADYTCHIRDPKVWQVGNNFYMVQGGRKCQDKGAVLLFASPNLYDWNYVKELTTIEPFGYMWECPDYFELQGQKVLSFCPQGLKPETFRYQNIYQSGYLLLDKNLIKEDSKQLLVTSEKFIEWDMGFDFYAPQTFLDERGRRILIGWAGIPDADYDNEPTVAQGWQHALTMPRQLTVKAGKILQNPVEEIKNLRKKRCSIPTGQMISLEKNYFELDVTTVKEADCKISIMCGINKIEIIYCTNGIITLQLNKNAGRGRKIRKHRLEKLDHLQIFVDTSMIEIYINHGESVFTSRFYFPKEERLIYIEGTKEAEVWYLSEMEGI